MGIRSRSDRSSFVNTEKPTAEDDEARFELRRIAVTGPAARTCIPDDRPTRLAAGGCDPRLRSAPSTQHKKAKDMARREPAVARKPRRRTKDVR
jgi:hypothetical protein